MNVNLKIENDAELRQHVKDLISGQVKSIVREEIKDILKDVLFRKIKDTNIPSVDFLMKQEIRQIVEKQLSSRCYGDPSFIQREAREIIHEYIKEAVLKKDIV